MKFTINQKLLKKELEFVQGVVEKKSTIPVLSNILIESIGNERIRIIGTDLDVTIRTEVEASVEQEGIICIQSRKLFEIIRLLGEQDVHFESDVNEWVQVKSGKSKFKLAGVSSNSFPEVPNLKKTPLKMSAGLFCYFIQHTSYAITQEQSRFTLSGAKLIINNKVAKMVATDGHRLAYIEKAVEDLGYIDVLIPKKALTELTKISQNSDNDVSFGEDPNHIYFEIDNRTIISRKLSGSFPNYEMVIPKSADKVVKFNADEMKLAVRRVSLMADERVQSIKFCIRKGEIEISSQAAEEGEAHEIIKADYDDEEVTLGFNWKYLLDALQTDSFADETDEDDGDSPPTTNETLCLSFKDANGQVMFHPESNDFLSVVMPLRV